MSNDSDKREAHEQMADLAQIIIQSLPEGMYLDTSMRVREIPKKNEEEDQ